MDREKLAFVMEGQIVVGDERFDVDVPPEYWQQIADGINAAASAWLDREVKKAVDAERERCTELARTFPWKLKVYGKAEIDEATDDTACEICDQIAAAIRSAAGKDKNG